MHTLHIPSSTVPMQFDDFDDYVDSGQCIDRSLSPNIPPFDFDTNKNNFGSFGVDTLRAPKPLLRSRPAIDFSGRHSTIYPSQLPSLTSGSTHSSSNHSIYPRKADFIPQFSPEAIASLTISELYHNPHFRKLRQQFDYVSGALAMYRDRERAESQAAKSNILVPDIHQGSSHFLIPRHLLSEYPSTTLPWG
jgi:hypothetical protein